MMSIPTPPPPDDERVVEEVARAIYGADPDIVTFDGTPVPWDAIGEEWREYHHTLAAAAIARYRAAQDGGICGDLSPSISDGRVLRLMCELPFGHGGAHQHDNGDGLPPTCWVATQAGDGAW